MIEEMNNVTRNTEMILSVAVGLVFNAGGVKDVLLELFNKIIGV